MRTLAALISVGMGRNTIYCSGDPITFAGSARVVKLPPRQPRLDMHQLSVGAVTGLLAGYVIGRLSTFLGLIFGGSAIALQLLESRGLIQSPWAHLAKTGSATLRRISRDMLKVSSFRIAFAATFLIGVFYA